MIRPAFSRRSGRLAIAAALIALAPAAGAAQEVVCGFGATAGQDPFEVTLTRDGASWTFGVEDEAFAAEPILMSGSTAAHFLIAPVDKAADAVALMSFFEDGRAFLSVHGDFFGGNGVTREGTCARETG